MLPVLAAPAPWLAGGAWWWPLAGAAASGVAAAAAVQRRRWWRQSTRALIDQREQLQQLERERDVAQRSDQDKSRFLAIASHDLRQPVHALGLFAATLHGACNDRPTSRWRAT